MLKISEFKSLTKSNTVAQDVLKLYMTLASSLATASSGRGFNLSAPFTKSNDGYSNSGELLVAECEAKLQVEEGEEDEDAWSYESENGDGDDVKMGDGEEAPQLVDAKEKEPPEIDKDGFTSASGQESDKSGGYSAIFHGYISMTYGHRAAFSIISALVQYRSSVKTFLFQLLSQTYIAVCIIPTAVAEPVWIRQPNRIQHRVRN